MNSEFKEVFKIFIGILVLAVIVILLVVMCTNNNGISLSIKPRILKVFDENDKVIFQQQIPEGVKIKSVIIE